MEVPQRDLSEDKYRPAPLLRKMVDAHIWEERREEGFTSINRNDK